MKHPARAGRMMQTSLRFLCSVTHQADAHQISGGGGLIVSHRADWQLPGATLSTKHAGRLQTPRVDKPWRQKPGCAASMIETCLDVTYSINHSPGVTKYVIYDLY